MFAVTRFRATGDDAAALAAAVAAAAGRAGGPAGLPGRRARPVRRRPGPVGAGHPVGRRRLLPAGAVGRRGEDHRRARLGARPRRAGRLRHRLTLRAPSAGTGRRRPTLRHVASRTVSARHARKRKRGWTRVEHDLSPEQWAALQDGLGRLRVLRRDRDAAAARLRPPDLPRRALHPRQHRAGVPLVQCQQVQRRGHRLAAAQAARRARLPGPPRRDQGDPRRAVPRRRRGGPVVVRACREE